MRSRRVLSLATALLVAACGGDGPTGGRPTAATVQVTASAPTMAMFSSVAITAVIRDRGGRTLTDRDIMWRAEPSGRVALTPGDRSVTVTGVAEGTVTVTGSVVDEPHAAASVSLTVTRAPVSRVEVSGVGPVAVGDTLRLTARTYRHPDVEVTGRGVAWSSANESVATVSPAGVVTGVRVGTTEIRATSEGVSASVSITVGLPLLEAGLRQVVSGLWHSCALAANGAAWCWGYNNFGQLGDGTKTVRTRAVRVAGNHTFTSLAAGTQYTCGVTEQGAVLCWGSNDNGQLGGGATDPRLQPTPVAGLPAPARAVAASTALTCALGDTGAAWCWGHDGAGMAGTGQFQAELLQTPTAVSGGHSFTSLVLGETHACGLAGGRVLCWGWNAWGMVGDGTTTTRTAPVPVVGEIGPVQQLAAGGRHTCALGTDGIARCWGDNATNQLATLPPNPGYRSAPASIAPASLRLTGIGSGTYAYHTCGMAAGGALHCWGSNGQGQRGAHDPASPFGATPIAQGELAFRDVAAGNMHTCALTTEGRAYCWGDNSRGQLGDGTTAQRLTPTAVQDGR